MLGLFRKRTTQGETPAKPSEAAQSYITAAAAWFATRGRDSLNNGRDSLLAEIEKTAFRVTAKQAKVRKPDGVTVAMDDYTDGANSAVMGPNAFKLGRQSDIVPANVLAWYALQSFPGYNTLSIMARHWLIQRALTLPARDAMNNGYDIKLEGEVEDGAGILEAIRKANKKFCIDKHMVELVSKTREFGLRVAIFKVRVNDEKTWYESPFRMENVAPGTYQGIVQVDPIWCTPELSVMGATDPASQDFYVPEFWTIGGKRYHKSHLVIATGDEVADTQKPTYNFGGVSVTQKIFERVYASERTANEAPQLTMTKRARTLKTNLHKPKDVADIFAMLQWRTEVMDNYGTDVIGRDDTIEMHETALGDLDVTIMTQYQLVASIAGVPATKMLGTSPKGFNATGAYEEKNYHEELATIRENDMNPLLERHIAMVIKSEIEPRFQPIAGFDIVWRSPYQPGENERADLRVKSAQADQIYYDLGVLNSDDIAERLQADPNSGYSHISALDDDTDDGEII